MKLAFFRSIEHHLLIAGLVTFLPMLALLWVLTSGQGLQESSSGLGSQSVKNVATLVQTKNSSKKITTTEAPQLQSAVTPAPSTPSMRSSTSVAKSAPSSSKPADGILPPMPPLTALELHQTTPQSPGEYWVMPVGSMPLGSQYTFFWANGCNYPVPGDCINNNLSELEEYGNQYSSGSGSFDLPPGSYDPTSPLAVVVCESMNGQCRVTSNLIFIPPMPGE